MVGFYEVQVRDRACGERFRINSFLFTMATTLDTSCIVNSDAPIELTKSCLPNFHVATCILFKHFQVPGIICKVIVIPKTCVGTAIIWGIEMGCYKSQFFSPYLIYIWKYLYATYEYECEHEGYNHVCFTEYGYMAWWHLPIKFYPEHPESTLSQVQLLIWLIDIFVLFVVIVIQITIQNIFVILVCHSGIRPFYPLRKAG